MPWDSTNAMKVALQRAISLLRQNPRLWVPVIVATAVSFGVSLLLKLLTHKLTLALITRHSVFGSGTDYDYSRLRSPKVMALFGAIHWVGIFLVICFFTFALVATTQKVIKITATPVAARQNLPLPVLWFSTKVLAVYAFAYLILNASLRSIPLRFLHIAILPLAISTQILIALVAAVMAIRFLARLLHRHADASAIRSASGLAILTAFVWESVSFLLPRMEHPLFAFWQQMTQPAMQTILLAGNLLAALPYAVFFVSVALLLDEEAPSESSAPALEPTPDAAPSAL